MIALRFYVVGVTLSELTPHHIKLRSLLTSHELVNSPLAFKMLVVLASLISLAGQAVAHYTFVSFIIYLWESTLTVAIDSFPNLLCVSKLHIKNALRADSDIQNPTKLGVYG